MKKNLLAVLCLILAIALVACGGGAGGNNGGSKPESEAPAETEEAEAPEEPEEAEAPAEAETTVVTGEAEGYGGPIQAEVTVDADGKIVDLVLTGEKETAEIGGAALPTLQEAIVKAGTVEGVDVVSGATWTSKGVFSAVNSALGIEEEPAAEEPAAEAVAASGLKHGLGIASTPRLGPGADDKEVPVYSLNEVVAYVITDEEDRIVDLEVDILELITPNHDGAEDNYMAGWPGAIYNNDEDGDGTVDGELEETEEAWVERLKGFITKRDLGSSYKMNSGTWAEEMDAYEEYFKGKTADEIQEAVATLFSDLNGRPLNGNSDKEEDIAKRDALTEEQLAEIDAMAGATMSINDAHGDMVTAICNAIANAKPIESDQEISKIGLGVIVTPRLGPGADDKEIPVYSFNVVMAGTALDAEDKLVATKVDILEIITPNHDSADDNKFAGWPGQKYNADMDGDEVTETELEQTEETFVEMASAYRTKRMLGSAYKMNSGTWEQEMDAYEAWLQGKTSAEIDEAVATLFSDLNGRPLNGNSDKEEDIAKRDALNEDQLAEIDALAGATMSINDAHGDMVSAIQKSIGAAK